MTSFTKDLLDEDPVIASQKFTCLSFVSPEEIIKKKELFYFEKFLKNWDYTKSMTKFAEFLNFVSYKYKLDANALMADFQVYVKEEEENLKSYNCDEDYKDFIRKNEEKLENEFSIDNKFTTNVRGIKIICSGS